MSTSAFIAGLLFLIGYLSLGLWFIHSAGQRRLNDIQQQLGQRVTTGLFRHTLLEMSAILRHDGEWAKPLDDCMDQATNPEIKMSASEDARLFELLDERVVSSHPEKRDGENDAALGYRYMLGLARREDESTLPLTGIKTIGTQAPIGMSDADQKTRNAN